MRHARALIPELRAGWLGWWYSQVPAQRAVLMEVCGVVALFRNQASNRGGQGVWRDV